MSSGGSGSGGIGTSQSNLARFAFNIYGTLNTSQSNDGSISPQSSSTASSSNRSTRQHSQQEQTFLNYDKLVYNCERETVALSQLNYPLQPSNYSAITTTSNHHNEMKHHVVIGGKNYLRLLCLNEDQRKIVQEINLTDSSSNSIYTSRVPNKLFNINTVKTFNDIIGCGLSNGLISIYKISPNGKSKIVNKFSDHKRTVNSLDFIETENQVLSGSQDGTIKLWDLRSSSSKPMLTLQANLHSDPIRACQYSPHSSVRNKICVLSVHDSGALCKFDLRSSGGGSNSNFQNMYSPDKKWNLHSGPALSLHIHPEKEYVLTGGRDHKICVFNYGENQTNVANRTSPDHMINTYGPILKVRWSTYPLSSYSHHPFDEFQETGSSTNPLFNYDIACSYLNDDSTITVYNLSRKYIPKQIIRSIGCKPIQNFIWTKNHMRSRQIWSITKANIFTSYELDNVLDPDIRRPLNELSSVSMSWNNNLGDLCFVNQNKDDFELGDDNDSLITISEMDPHHSQQQEFESSDMILERSHTHSLETTMENDMELTKSNSVVGMQSFTTSLTTSPVEKPPLFRSFTHNPMHNSATTKTPSPIPVYRTTTTTPGMNLMQQNESTTSSFGGILRPKLNRNSSQATQESIVSLGSTPHQRYTNAKPTSSSQGQQNLISSPYVIPFSLPIPANDEFVFRFLSANYMVNIPDGFNLVDVCLFNANSAANAGSYRTCQVWRLLAVSIEEDYIQEKHTAQEQEQQQQQQQDGTAKTEIVVSEVAEKETRSISSELGNFVGSYNSTSTTGYGGSGSTTGKQGGSTDESAIHDRKLMPGEAEEDEMTSNDISIAGSSSDPGTRSRTNSLSNLRLVASPNSASREDVDNGEEDLIDEVISEPGVDEMLSRSAPVSIMSIPQRSKTNEDIDDENLNLIKNTLLGTSPSGTPGLSGRSSQTFSSIAISSSPQSYHAFPPKSIHTTKTRTNASGEFSALKSGLSMALKERDGEEDHDVEKEKDHTEKDWKFTNLLRKVLDYALLQGDIVFVATVVLIFYDICPGTITQEECLDWLSIYIDILQRKRLFINAANVLNSAPLSVLEILKNVYSVDLDLRLYCTWCRKLLVNEKSKRAGGNFGYWYCDECSKTQMNCVYCCEPCKGLGVVVSLKCGHRGHFGCLKEWFIEDENIECPGGCDFSIS
ncbi:RTC1 [[Candida] subhashii]|uniref:Restriction of telomere capping protein 1 n=1 Tax=[Candida] subhashii TaxID=561895 RepID=A0A8J5QNN1_9ASCO|nr:RTC1 [[Candida] subhashii]KAG7663705.1 RTC1 [[Candida] subhashii]